MEIGETRLNDQFQLPAFSSYENGIGTGIGTGTGTVYVQPMDGQEGKRISSFSDKVQIVSWLNKHTIMIKSGAKFCYLF